MKRTKKDVFQDIVLNTLRPLVYIWMFFDMRVKVHKGEGVNFKTKKPYIMLANHTYLFDVVQVPMRWKVASYVVASQTLFTHQPTKFLFTHIAHIIPKSKGESDLRTARGLIGAVKRGYPILIFPEGNTTFYGSTKNIEESTMKLIKKLKVDVITCNVKGGYLSKPRWATGKRKNRRAELNYELTIPKDELKDLSIEQIRDKVHKALYNNDYEYQRKAMIEHPGKQLAEGLENVIYICPKCEAINSIETLGNDFSCSECKTKGYVDKYGFLHGFKYDNLLDWDVFQKPFKSEVEKAVIESSGFLNYLRFEDDARIPVGPVELIYKERQFHFSGALNEVVDLKDIRNPIITLRRDLSFDYGKRHFIIKLDRFGASLLRVAQNKY